MFTLLTNVPDSLDELVAESSPPWVWLGFVFGVAFLFGETAVVILEFDEASANLPFILIGLAGWIYWMFCVHRFHKILIEMSRNRYPIGAGEAVGKHFIPFFNLIWIFRWPTAMSDYLNARGRVQVVSGKLLGLLLLLSALTARLVDGGVGLIGIFAVGIYISTKLRRHMQLVKGQILPPPPPDWRVLAEGAKPADNIN